MKNEERTPFDVDQKYGQVSGKWRGQWCNYMTMMIETCDEAQRGKGLSSPVPIEVVMEGKRSWFSLSRLYNYDTYFITDNYQFHHPWACNLNTWRNVENAPNKTEGGVLMKKKHFTYMQYIAIEALAIPSVCVSYRFRRLAHLTKWVFLQWSDFLEHVTRLVGNQKTFPFSMISDIVRSRR